MIRDSYHRPLRMDTDSLRRWHRATFRTTFPGSAGRLRDDDVEFGIRWRDDRGLHRQGVRGVAPQEVERALRAAFDRYDAAVRSCPLRSTRRAAEVAGGLYAELLRIHPFEDGNLRVAFPALQGALISLGGGPVTFERCVAAHDEALGGALRPEPAARTIGPFADLLMERMRQVNPRSCWRHDGALPRLPRAVGARRSRRAAGGCR